MHIIMWTHYNRLVYLFQFILQRFAPVHPLLLTVSFPGVMSPGVLEAMLNTPVEAATTWWVPALEHAKLVVTGLGVLQPVKRVRYLFKK